MLERVVNTVNRIPNMGRYFTQSKTVQDAINLYQIEYFKKLRGDGAFYRPMQPYSPMGVGQTALNTELLKDFLRTNTGLAGEGNIVVTDPDGREIALLLDVALQYGENRFKSIKVYMLNQYDLAVSSLITPPTQKLPYAKELSDGLFEYEPINATAYKATYLVTPEPCEFSYTGRMVAGVPEIVIVKDLEWEDQHLDQLVWGTLSVLGINMQRGDITQYSKQQTETSI